jgi:4-amino-4-deoxy-L-arabinose transferase-like glycosyltransferase
VITLTLTLVAWLAGFVQQNSAYSFDSDEGVHAYEALRLSTYLREGDLAGALAASLRQSFYPPAHPWLLGIALTFLPATHITARLCSLAVYALDVLLLYALGRRLAQESRWPWLAGLAAALSMLAASPAWVMGSLVYIEMLGVLFVLLTFWGYWQGVEGREWGWLVAGLGIVATGLTKYPYWLFLIIPLPLTLVAQEVISPQRNGRVLKRLALTVAPSATVLLIWVALPVTRSGLADYIVATQDLSAQAQASLLAHLFFYLKSIAIHFCPSPLLAAGWAVALIASALRWRDDRLRPLVFFFVWHLISISTHGGLAPRFLTTAMPALWLMGGIWAARMADAWSGWIARLGTQKRGVRLALWAALAALGVTVCLGLSNQLALYPTLYMLSLETDARAESLYRWTANVLPPGPARIGLVNDWDQMSGPTLGWELTTRRASTPRQSDWVTVWEIHRLADPTPENAAILRNQMNQRGINYLVAYTAPGVGIKRLQGTLAILGDQVRALGERDFPLRWYWPDKIDHRLYDGERLDEEQLRQAVEQLGTERSLTIHVYAYQP